MNFIKKHKAYTLVEYVIFSMLLLPALLLFVNGIATFTNIYLQANTYFKAFELAKTRMEVIKNQRTVFGFHNLADPCNTQLSPLNELCAVPQEYVISSQIIDDDIRHKIVTVNIQGPYNINVNLNYRVAQYEL